MIDLGKELQEAALSMGPLDFPRLRSLGLINTGVAEMGMRHHQFGLATIVDVGEGLFAPSPDGRRSMVVPVYENGQLLDLVAFSTSTPDDWLLRTGAGLALGLIDGFEPHTWGASVHLHKTPMDWLRAGGDGLCIVDWSAPDIYLFNDLPHITVDDDGLRSQLVAAVQRPAHIVPVSVKKEQAIAA